MHSLNTLGSAFSEAQIKGLTFPALQYASDLDDDDMRLILEETGNTYPSYHGTATIYYRMSLVDAYDLSYTQTEFLGNQTVTNDRLLGVEYAEGVSGEMDFEDISSFDDKTSLCGAKGTEVSIDNTIRPGQDSVLKITLKLTKEQLDALPTPEGGSGGGFWASSGFFGGFMNWISAALGTIGIDGLIASRRLGNNGA